jgi:hypothetical protein
MIFFQTEGIFYGRVPLIEARAKKVIILLTADKFIVKPYKDLVKP